MGRCTAARLHAICRQNFEAGSRNFSIPVIGKECEAQGIIKSRALYNAKSADYKTLIDAWAVFSEAENEGAKPDAEAPLSAAKYVFGILDPVINARVLELIRDRDNLKVRVSLLQANNKALEETIKKLPKYDAKPAAPRGRPLKNVSIWELKPDDVEALKKAISPDFIESQGWRPGSKGEVLDSQGGTVYEPEYRQAIKKVLANKKGPG